MTSPLQRPFFVVEGLIPQGLNTPVRFPKNRQELADAVAGIAGGAWRTLCGNFATHRCDVLYLCLEDTYARIQAGWQQLTEEAPETLRFSVLCQRLGSGLQEQLEDF